MSVFQYEFKDLKKFFQAEKEKEKKKPLKVVKLKLDNKPIKKSKKSKLEKQIVNSEKSLTELKPDNTRFLSDKNQRADRQTIAKKVSSFKKAGKGEKTGNRKKDSGKKVAKKKAQKKQQKTVASKSKSKKFSLSDIGLAKTPELMKIEKKSPEDTLEGIKKGIKHGDASLSGLAANNDFIDDVPLGDMTKLNTHEYKFFGFYDRIRKKLEQYWGNSLQNKAKQLYKTGRRIASNENLITSLTVVLDHKGNIVNVLVKSSSGIRELDSAAIESFNRAGPFPNPPQGMVKNGKVTINWGFVVKS